MMLSQRWELQFAGEGEKSSLLLSVLSGGMWSCGFTTGGEKSCYCCYRDKDNKPGAWSKWFYDYAAKLQSPGRTPLMSYPNNVHIEQPAFGDTDHFCWCTFWPLTFSWPPATAPSCLTYLYCSAHIILFLHHWERNWAAHSANEGKLCNINAIPPLITQDSFVASQWLPVLAEQQENKDVKFSIRSDNQWLSQSSLRRRH